MLVQAIHLIAATADGSTFGLVCDYTFTSDASNVLADCEAAMSSDPPDVRPGTIELLWARQCAGGIGAAEIRPHDGSLLVLGLWDGSVEVLDAHSGKRVACLEGVHSEGIAAIAMITDPTYIALEGRRRRPLALVRSLHERLLRLENASRGTLTIADKSSGVPSVPSDMQLQKHPSIPGDVRKCVAEEYGGFIVASRDRTISLWNVPLSLFK